MQRLWVSALLLLTLSCDGAQIYTTQSTDEATGISAAVMWRYTVLMDRLLVKDFDPAAISNKQFVNIFIKKTMDIVNKKLTSDIQTALKVVGILTALQGKFPANSATGKGLKKFIDAAMDLGLNTDKSRTKQLSDEMNTAMMALFENAEIRRALAGQGSFISKQFKGPPDLMAKIFDNEFVNEILALQESQIISQVIDIPTFFDEMINTMHLILNDAVLMEEMSDPVSIGAASLVLSNFFRIYGELRADRDNHDVNSVKTHIAAMLSKFNDKQRTGAITFSEALWLAAYPVHFKKLKHSDPCDSPAWQAVQDLDGASLVNNLPDTAITALQLCRLSARSCDEWDEWDEWTPAPNTTCEGETLSQTRTRARTCPTPCNLADCDTTDTEAQSVDGTKVCVVEPVCENTCELGCRDWEIWQSKAWSPSQDSVCSPQKMQQRRSRTQRRTCPNLCEGVKNCPTFQIIAPLKRTVEGTRYCDEQQPAPNCNCCDADNNEITQCPRDPSLPWNTDTCSCGSCNKETVIACGAVYSTGKLYDDRALDENCDCYYKTSRKGWTGALVIGQFGFGDRALLDHDCVLQNVKALKDDNEGRRIRTALWDDGCVTAENLSMGCTTAKVNKAKVREKFIDFHDRDLTSQTNEGYWGLGCVQVFPNRQHFEKRIISRILSCGDHAYSNAAWEQIGKPPYFNRIYKKTSSIFLERKIPEWGMYIQMCESDYQKNRPDRVTSDD